MAKNGVLKKIAALATAIILVVCFAVSASAVNVATTTAYTNGTEDVTVNVTVTGIDEGANVTYYAKKDAVDVHIDQAKATASGASFEFVTAATNLDSSVKVGYTGASEAEDADITGYTVTYPAGSKVYPTETTTVTFPYALGEGKLFNTVNVTAGTATVANATYADGTVTVTFDAKLAGDVTLAVATTDAPQELPTATAEFIDANAIVSTGSVDKVVTGGREDEKGNWVNGVESEDAEVNAAEGNRKITVIGLTNSDAGYGIVISESAITSGTYSQAEFEAMTSYEGATKSSNGLFAIQLIDTSDAASEDAFIKAGTNYYVAIYSANGDGRYVIEASAEAVQAN